MISADKEAGPSRSSASDPRRALVDRVIMSSTFAKCERLSSLLAYVCDLSLSGRAKELNEQNIGEAVFGRSQNYDSSIDGIVRTQASRLRQRLELYFNEEGLDEPIRIVIPRGGYVPYFEPRPAPQATSVPSSPLIPPPTVQVETARAEARGFNVGKRRPGVVSGCHPRGNADDVARQPGRVHKETSGSHAGSPPVESDVCCRAVHPRSAR